MILGGAKLNNLAIERFEGFSQSYELGKVMSEKEIQSTLFHEFDRLILRERERGKDVGERKR